MNKMDVPFLDLQSHHAPLRQEIDAAIARVIDTCAFAGGPFVSEFETDFAQYCGTRHAIGVGSGTEALWLTLLALGIGPGDEVITVPSTFMATAEAITYCGATPVFVDIDEATYTMDPAAIPAAITPRTKAIIPVHLFGQIADMDAINAIAEEYGLFVVGDACQAHGAEYKGRKAGSLGDAGCFSFYPGKNLGAFGEAGAITTNDAALDRTIRVLRDHGQVRKYHHTMIGWNCRMDGIQAAVLGIKLRHLDDWNKARRAHAQQYDAGLRDVPDVITPATAADQLHVYHVYALRVQQRDEVMRQLGDLGIGCGIHYPVPVHLQEAYRGLGYGPGSFPVAEMVSREFLSLPMYPHLTRSQIDRVIDGVKTSVASGVLA
jgi:dTDP-4-amino-4,6-dideoxygalactose transaminase